MKHKQKFWFAVLALAACVPGGAAEPAAAQTTPAPTAEAQPPVITLNIAPQPIGDALNEFGRQSGLHVVLYSSLGQGIMAPRVAGKFTARAALAQLLANSGLRFEYLDARTIAILREGEKLSNQKLTALLKSLDTSDGGGLQLAGVDAAAPANAATKQKTGKDGVEEMVVEEGRIREPFSDRNIDLPRGVDDVQPYYIFDARTIERSGAVNVEEFLKFNLTMNTVKGSNNQQYGGANVMGNLSAVNLRGLGTNNTLILVNGRRLASVSFTGTEYQTDLNGIALSSIERIEVLPTSASGIYGGGAIGGVVNVILKKQYAGGELRASYQDTWDGVAPNRTLSGVFGTSFEGGKSSLMLSGHYADAQPMVMGDRIELLRRAYGILLVNKPGVVSYGYGTTYPLMGATPNIGSCCSNQNLTLKGSGISLNSPIATLPAGYSSGSSTASIIPGQWNLNFADVNASPTGLRYNLGNFPKTQSAMAVFRRAMSSRLDLHVDVNHMSNRAFSDFNPFLGDGGVYVPSATPTNPFNQDVIISFPSDVHAPNESESVTQSVTVGGELRLPRGWKAQLDVTWSRNRFDSSYFVYDYAIYGGFSSGALNPFVDTQRYPIDFSSYLVPRVFANRSRATSIGLRAAGPVTFGRWQPTVAASLNQHRQSTPDNTFAELHPLTPVSDQITTYLGQSSTAQSAYLEVNLPLVAPRESRPLLKALEVQASGRADRYIVTAGTPVLITLPNATPPSAQYSGPTLNGQPYRYETDYLSNNKTLGLKYRPLRDIVIRASNAAAFLPPTYTQLLPNPQPDTYRPQVTDPLNLNPVSLPPNCTASSSGVRCTVQTVSGGNPDLKPQNSESWNAGIIWEPAGTGLRINAEYYQIDQFDRIASLSAQQIVNMEGAFPGRVIRDAGTGRITTVNIQLLNLTKYETAGWDYSVDLRKPTVLGSFGLRLAATRIAYERRQDALSAPLRDFVGFANNGGEVKVKGYAALDWERNGLALGWTARYVGPYKQTGAPGDPNGNDRYYVEAQGSEIIGSQMYHDLHVSYVFPGQDPSRALRAGVLSGVKLQLGIRNVFDRLPPFDARDYPFYYSHYGDLRLRDYTLSVTKGF